MNISQTQNILKTGRVSQLQHFIKIKLNKLNKESKLNQLSKFYHLKQLDLL